jgi:exonuclease VII small subunit
MSYKPLFPYNGEQIIFNSNRISLNSKEDSIFLFSSKVIALSSNEGIHLNTNKNIILNGEKIQIGLNANEPLVKGNQLYNLLERLINDLENAGEQLNESIDSNGNPIPQTQTAGNNLIKSCKRLKILLKNINSTQNYTI